MYGPLEYVLFKFDDDRFMSEMLPTLLEIQQQGCVGVVDMVFVVKDEGGDLERVEIDQLAEEDQAAFEPLLNNYSRIMTDGDVAFAANDLPENTYAAVLLLEHRWALRLHQAVDAAGGLLLDSAHINPQTQAEVIAEIKQLEADNA